MPSCAASPSPWKSVPCLLSRIAISAVEIFSKFWRFPMIKYTEDHEWINVDGDVATVGITHHAQDALGDVVFVDLPSVGTSFAQKEVAGVVESVKAAADVYMPISGEVTEVNEALRDDPSLANTDPMGA